MALEVCWACPDGHHRQAHRDAVGLWCPEGGHKGSNAMKPRDRYPSWSPEEPAEGWGRRCCRSYPGGVHRDGCRYAGAPAYLTTIADLEATL